MNVADIWQISSSALCPILSRKTRKLVGRRCFDNVAIAGFLVSLDIMDLGSDVSSFSIVGFCCDRRRCWLLSSSCLDRGWDSPSYMYNDELADAECLGAC